MAMDTLLNVPEMLFIISVNIYMVGIVYVNILALLNNFSKKKKRRKVFTMTTINIINSLSLELVVFNFKPRYLIHSEVFGKQNCRFICTFLLGATLGWTFLLLF